MLRVRNIGSRFRILTYNSIRKIDRYVKNLILNFYLLRIFHFIFDILFVSRFEKFQFGCIPKEGNHSRGTNPESIPVVVGNGLITCGIFLRSYSYPSFTGHSVFIRESIQIILL